MVVQYIVMAFVAFLVIILSIALVEWIITDIFNVHLGYSPTGTIFGYVIDLFKAILEMIASPFQALTEGVFGAEWGYAGNLIMGLVVLIIIVVVVWFVYGQVAEE